MSARHGAFPSQHFVVGGIRRGFRRAAGDEEDIERKTKVVHHQQLLVFRLDCGSEVQMPSHDLDGLTCVASRRVKFPQFAFANRIVHQCSGIGGMIFSQKLLVDGQGFREDRLRFRVAALPGCRNPIVLKQVA